MPRLQPLRLLLKDDLHPRGRIIHTHDHIHDLRVRRVVELLIGHELVQLRARLDLEALDPGDLRSERLRQGAIVPVVDVVVPSGPAAEEALDGVALVVEDEDDRRDAEAVEEGEALDGELHAALSCDEDEALVLASFLGCDGGSGGGAGGVADAAVDGLGPALDAIGEDGAPNAGLAGACLDDDEVAGLQEGGEALRVGVSGGLVFGWGRLLCGTYVPEPVVLNGWRDCEGSNGHGMLDLELRKLGVRVECLDELG